MTLSSDLKKWNLPIRHSLVLYSEQHFAWLIRVLAAFNLAFFVHFFISVFFSISFLTPNLKKKNKQKIKTKLHLIQFVNTSKQLTTIFDYCLLFLCVCEFICARKREREREREICIFVPLYLACIMEFMIFLVCIFSVYFFFFFSFCYIFDLGHITLNLKFSKLWVKI